MRIIIFGPQGSGKGTQAEMLARRHGVCYISTGDIFRYHIQKKTDLGKIVEEYVVPGKLVPDDITNTVVRQRLEQPDCVAGFVLDGYPRDEQQYDFLSSLTPIDAALYIRLSDTWAVERLSSRLACICGLSYNLLTNPPVSANVCDRCGQVLFRRPDDEPEAIAKRLSLYHQKTEPLLQRYRQHGILVEVDGQQSIEHVAQAIDQALRVKVS